MGMCSVRRAISACILAALVAPSVAAQGNGVWREDDWLAEKEINPCTIRRAPCDYFLRNIYDEIIDARQRGDADALERWSRRLRLYHISNPDDRPGTE